MLTVVPVALEWSELKPLCDPGVAGFVASSLSLRFGVDSVQECSMRLSMGAVTANWMAAEPKQPGGVAREISFGGLVVGCRDWDLP
jgi:hypothetical protein